MSAAQHGNGPNPDRTRECVTRIEALHQKKERAHMAYMAECAVIAEDVKVIVDEAKAAWGIPKRALKTVIKVRAGERKLAKLREDLEADDQESFDQIRHALGDLADTPLGRAVTGETFDSDIRGTDQKDREAFRLEFEGKDGDKRDGKGRRKRAGDDALNAAVSTDGAADNGAAQLATGLRPLKAVH